ncbi:MAG: hypothetical protein COY81_01965 [Candidatus Pacebacteria bacterium CG_4_10_14_0_8_um_filter_43_12]|nr:MAG: hypothetical protein COY81_01965 [Candidatus Pacebacteria bacterium CG_4_10_14_0_8_um_filter_43_12]
MFKRSPSRLLVVSKLMVISIFVLLLFGAQTKFVEAENCDDIVCNANDADYVSCLGKKKSCLEGKLSETQAQKSSLSNAIAIISGRINLQQLKIYQTQAEIVKLEKELEQLSERINGLDLSLDRLTGMLVERIRAQYKESRVSPFTALASAGSFSEMFAREQYVNLASQQTATAMQRAEMQKMIYDQEKELKEKKQEEIEVKRQQLQTEQNTLSQERAQQQQLLAVTKNDETKYQQLLKEAQAQIDSFKKFVQFAGDGGTIAADSLGKGYDGSYFSQRDERWAGNRIGNSSESVYEVGCLVTSVAMAVKSRGVDTTPAEIAGNSSYFWLNTAYMLSRSTLSLPGGKRGYNISPYSTNISAELEKGNAVVTGLKAGPYGTHFIVLKKTDGNNWIMYDPWYGPDIKMIDHYSISQIYSAEIIL